MALCRVAIVTWGMVLLACSSGWAQTLVAAVLPSSRSVFVGGSAAVFATVINGGQQLATGCSISLPIGSIPGKFGYTLVGADWDWVGEPIDIPAGEARHFIVIATASGPFPPTEVPVTFVCANTAPAPIFPGVNTFLLTASITPVADIVAVAKTATDNGIAALPGPFGLERTGVFTVATVNMGAGDTLTVSADTGSAILPVSTFICQTDPKTSVCLSPPGGTVSTTVLSNDRPTFGVFLTATRDVPFIPQTNRVHVRFKDSGGVTRGATSVAVWTSDACKGCWDY
jgi:hypothetical protein